MSEAVFHERVDNLFLQVEHILDEAQSDIDFVNSSGLLTISCENKSQIILSRQPPLEQVWLACLAGGLHFKLVQDVWVLTTDSNQTFGQRLTQALQQQADETFNCSLLDSLQE
ncbi:MAG: iron donor protein CyaY [Pseudomonadales bacterium]|jgi:CyaY protein|tara:strand:- start:788 stop:1126 length:339 start_codon:yes stop_codon:yes gene_type:complete